MSVSKTCASSATETVWHSIDWSHCHRRVKKLQMRIVKATQEGRFGKVNSLQRLLTHSFSGKAIAVKRVTENQGKNTPGIDNITWSTPRSKSDALLSLKQRGYKPQPLKRVYIPKSNGKLRPLSIPVMKCRANVSKLVMIHPNCHRKIHSQALTVVKPVSRVEKF